MTRRHHPRRTVKHRTEVIPLAQLGLAGRQPHPHRQLQRPLRSHRSIDRRPGRGEGGAHPVAGVLEQKPPCASISPRSTSSWAASATRIASASASHRRVEPSTSVNRNVTTPEGAAARSADTPAESHNRPRLPRTSADPARSTHRWSRLQAHSAVNRAIINCGDRPAASRAPMKEGVTWKRTGPPATPVPITHASPRATTMSTTRHTTCRPGRCMKLQHHIESIPHRGYSSARAGTMATTRPTISAPDDQPRPESAYMSELFRLGPGHRIHVY